VQRKLRRAEELQALGRDKSAAEYRQLWELTVGALEQCDGILGDSVLDYTQFGRLFTLMLSKYDIGTIPVSLDRVTAGDFDRNRRRDVRHLIVLGASDDRLPMAEEAGGIFSPDERQRLLELDLVFHDAVSAAVANPMVDSVTNYIARLTVPSRRATTRKWLKDKNENRFVELHRQIVDVLKNKDKSRIEEVVEAHYAIWSSIRSDIPA
jgi:hypothetical protein